MFVTIHRGSNEIGGTCVELRSGESRIVLDVGMPLVRPNGGEFDMRVYKGLSGKELVERGVLPPVEGLYEWETPLVDGVLISHAHQDHYGFLGHVHPEVPIYLSEGTQKLIEITSDFTPNDYTLRNTRRFVWRSNVDVGAFRVTPHLVDHSSFSAFAFEIAAEGKRVFYSGDFRDHGYIGPKALGALYGKVAPGVDALLMEGTMLGRDDGRVQTEEELSLAATELCKQTEKAVLVYQSGQNVTRAVAFYRGAKRTGRFFVPDIYTAHVLGELGSCTGGESLPYPGKKGFENVRAWYPKKLTEKIKKSGRMAIIRQYQPWEMTKDDMTSDLRKVMLLVRPGMEGDLRKIGGLEGSILIYSQWEGYREKDWTGDFLESVEKLGVTVHSLHTSGHADVPALQKMVTTLAPKRLVPIHTFHPGDYARLFGDGGAQIETRSAFEL